jgi:hypothetical protein
MPRISQLDPLTGLSNLDMFEVTQRANNKSCSITAQEMSNYFKTLQNGSFKGSTDKALDSFTMADVGVWYWTGDGGATGVSYGIVEIIGYQEADNTPGDDKYVQKITCKDQVYQRMKDGTWSNWAALTNRNGAKIEYGTTDEAHVTFAVPYAAAPTVIVTPVNGPSSRNIVLANVYGVTERGFDIFKVKSNLEASVEETVETTTETGGTTTKTVTTDITRGAWVQDDALEVRWMALSDAGN